ncbi:uncharacterized conserved protein UCP006173, partial [endosymbiont of Tevnia jerichonana (vent Tica)]
MEPGQCATPSTAAGSIVTIPFWRSKPLEQLSASEWELLCDGCAKCCLQKLEDAETREIYFTNVVCDLL